MKHVSVLLSSVLHFKVAFKKSSFLFKILLPKQINHFIATFNEELIFLLNNYSLAVTKSFSLVERCEHINLTNCLNNGDIASVRLLKITQQIDTAHKV